MNRIIAPAIITPNRNRNAAKEAISTGAKRDCVKPAARHVMREARNVKCESPTALALLVAVIGTKRQRYTEGAGHVHLEENFQSPDLFVCPFHGGPLVIGGLLQRSANGSCGT